VIEELVAFHLAGLAVSAVQFLRSRDPRLLPLVGLFAALAAAHTRSEWDPAGRALHYAAGACALALAFALGRRRST
jgi:hypothetical protein